MKAILEFDLPEDKELFEAASKATDWAILAWDMDNYIRNRIKYQMYKDSSTAQEELELIRNELHNLLEDSGLKFLS